MSRPVAIINLAMALCLGCGCAAERITQYPLMPVDQTLKVLRHRADSLKSISGEASLRLTRENGESVRLDAAIVLAPPNRARVRTWKFGQAIFDLTVTPDGVYLVAPKESASRQQIEAAGTGASTMIRNWLKLLSGSFDAANAVEKGNELIIRQRQPDGTTLLCTVDRRTITARSYKVLDEQQRERFALVLSRYIESNGQVWPRRIEASSESGQIELEFRDVEINGEPPAAAFTPPARAEKLP